APIAAEVHEALDVHCDLAPEIALDHELAIDVLANAQDLVIGELMHPTGIGNADGAADLVRPGPADSVDVGERHLDPLLRRNVHACDARHALDLLYDWPGAETSRPARSPWAPRRAIICG